MKKTVMMSILAMLSLGFCFTSCSDDDDDPVVVSQSTLTLEIPANLQNVVLSDAQAILTNVETNKVAEGVGTFVKNGSNYEVTVTDIEEGTYNVQVKGHLDFTLNGIAGQKDFDVTSENVKISQAAPALKVAVSTFTAQGGFVISEIFFTGTLTEDGNQYMNDQYIKIANNSDVTLYADSIAVLESEFLTTDKQEYTPDIMSTHFAVDAVYMIPGTGKSVAVEPGQELLLAINAVNHKEANPLSIDLTGADFEFFDVSNNPNFADPDGEAENLDKWYCYTYTIYNFHNRGFHSMAIAKMQTTKEDWLENYTYEADWTFVFGEYSFPRTLESYKVPNSWILDGVNLSIESMWQWNTLDASIDKGWTYCGKVDRDADRYNKSVIRKKDANGKFIDTNDSATDFEAEATPSLLK